MSKPFTHSFRVRYAEVDPQAIVFNSRYLEYADILVTEWFRELGIGANADEPMEFHVARAVIDYTKPIRVDEMVDGRLSVSRIGNSSMTLRIDLHGPEGEEDRRARIELVQVHVDLASGQSQALPDRVRAKVGEYRDNG